MVVQLEDRKFVADACELILEHQYVDSFCDPVLLFKVVNGSGQGLKHSGAISNAAFLHHAELNGARLARSDVRIAHGVLE